VQRLGGGGERISAERARANALQIGIVLRQARQKAAYTEQRHRPQETRTSARRHLRRWRSGRYAIACELLMPGLSSARCQPQSAALSSNARKRGWEPERDVRLLVDQGQHAVRPPRLLRVPLRFLVYEAPRYGRIRPAGSRRPPASMRAPPPSASPSLSSRADCLPAPSRSTSTLPAVDPLQSPPPTHPAPPSPSPTRRESAPADSTVTPPPLAAPGSTRAAGTPAHPDRLCPVPTRCSPCCPTAQDARSASPLHMSTRGRCQWSMPSLRRSQRLGDGLVQRKSPTDRERCRPPLLTQCRPRLRHHCRPKVALSRLV
jgi:hypothetical protein